MKTKIVDFQNNKIIYSKDKSKSIIDKIVISDILSVLEKNIEPMRNCKIKVHGWKFLGDSVQQVGSVEYIFSEVSEPEWTVRNCSFEL